MTEATLGRAPEDSARHISRRTLLKAAGAGGFFFAGWRANAAFGNGAGPSSNHEVNPLSGIDKNTPTVDPATSPSLTVTSQEIHQQATSTPDSIIPTSTPHPTETAEAEQPTQEGINWDSPEMIDAVLPNVYHSPVYSYEIRYPNWMQTKLGRTDDAPLLITPYAYKGISVDMITDTNPEDGYLIYIYATDAINDKTSQAYAYELSGLIMANNAAVADVKETPYVDPHLPFAGIEDGAEVLASVYNTQGTEYAYRARVAIVEDKAFYITFISPTAEERYVNEWRYKFFNRFTNTFAYDS